MPRGARRSASRAGELGRHRAAHDQDAARLHAVDDTLSPEHDLLGLPGVHDERDDDRAGLRHLRGRRAHGRPRGPRFVLRLAADVAHVHRVTAREQPLRDAHAHRPDPDHPCLRRHVIPLPLVYARFGQRPLGPRALGPRPLGPHLLDRAILSARPPAHPALLSVKVPNAYPLSAKRKEREIPC